MRSMSEIKLQIDDKDIEAKEGQTVLEVAHEAGISIPTLCYHEKLEPYAGCRLCMVEAEVSGRSQLVCSCAHPVEDNLVIKTRSKKIDKIRKTLLELLLSHAPDSPQLQELAEEYGADRNRYDNEASFCIHCGLCVRYCAEVKKENAVGFIDRGIRKEICFIPEIAMQVCNDCKECFPLCPTSYVQAAFVLTEALTSHR